MMGSVSVGGKSPESVFSLLEVIADPEKAKAALQEIVAEGARVAAEADQARQAAEARSAELDQREQAIKATEDKTAGLNADAAKLVEVAAKVRLDLADKAKALADAENALQDAKDEVEQRNARLADAESALAARERAAVLRENELTESIARQKEHEDAAQLSADAAAKLKDEYETRKKRLEAILSA